MSETGQATTTPAAQTTSTQTNEATKPADAWGDLAPEFREMVGKKGWTGPADALKSYTGLEKLIPQDKRLSVPPSDSQALATWEGWARLGVPDKPDAYELKRPELPEGMAYDVELETAAKSLAVEAKLAPWQLQKVLDGFSALQVARHGDAGKIEARAKAEADAALRAEWGGDYEKKVGLAKSAFTALAGQSDEDIAALEKVIGAPKAVKLLSKIGEMIGEDRLANPSGGSPANAGPARVEALKSDPNFMKALTTRNHPGHETAKKQWDQAHGIAA